MKKYIFLLTLILYTGLVKAQSFTPVAPLSFHQTLDSLPNPVIVLPPLSNASEQARADSIGQASNNYYGRGMETTINIKSQGRTEVLGDNSKIWFLELESPTAYGMQFYFEKFKLPDGAALFIYNEDRDGFLGGFTSINNPASESLPIQFGTSYIKGNKITFEYFEPANAEFPGELILANVIHIFTDVFASAGPFGTSLACQRNVACPEGNGWENEINSVVLILGYNANYDLATHCTGTLINNTDEDGTALLLTANHCIDDEFGSGLLAYNYGTWTFRFGHQSDDCDTASGGGIYNWGHTVYSAIPLAEDDPVNSQNTGITRPLTSDYLLLEINSDKEDLAFKGACLAGWDRNQTPNPTGNYIGIHHPKGDLKKISVSDNIESSTLRPDFYWRTNWVTGTTEGGSSGSPLFDNNHRIIGHLWGDNKTCPPNGFSLYGKFHQSWTEGDFGFRLDPFTTNATFVNTYCPVSNDPVYPVGGNGITYNCGTKFSRDLFMINGDLNNVTEVCLDEGIMIAPTNPHPIYPQQCAQSGTTFPLTYVKKRGNCNDLQQENPRSCETVPLTFGIKCDCKFYYIFISIMECDYNLNLIGPEYAEWKNMFQIPGFASNQAFNLLDYLPQGIVLQPNKYYKLKLASSQGNVWDEGTRYFHTYGETIHLNGYNLTYDIFGQNITLQNVTVNPNTDLTVTASNEIRILPNSTIKSGHYKIDAISCSSFKRTGEQNEGNTYEGKINNKTFYGESGLSEEPANVINSASKNINLHPNPNNGSFTLSIYSESQLTSDIQVYDTFGKVVFRASEVASPTLNIDISGHAPGIYLVRVQNGGEQFLKKVVVN